MTNLEPAINYFGSQKKLADALGLKKMSVTQWKKRGLPVERAIEISILTKGIIHPADLRPDVFIIRDIFITESGEKLQERRRSKADRRRSTANTS